jgi:DNA mismatch repair protein MutS
MVGKEGKKEVMAVMINEEERSVNADAGKPFRSILFANTETVRNVDQQPAPEFFKDLFLDQVVQTITEKWKDYNLAPFFHFPLHDLAELSYRQAVYRDLEDGRVLDALQSFCLQMKAMRERLKQSKDLYFHYAVDRGFLGAAEIYYQAVQSLCQQLSDLSFGSQGLREFHQYLAQYVQSEAFRKLVTDGQTLTSKLSQIQYCLLLKDDSVTVRHYGEEEDYSTTVEATFSKFRRDAAREYETKVPIRDGMNHIQAQILDGVALLYPDTFRALEDFSASHRDYLDDTIARFDREVQFYIAFLDYICILRRADLSFCLPKLSRDSKEIEGRDAFDIALASKLTRENVAVVRNDFFLSGAERLFVVSGPNQGGKTTFARMFGQLHYIASLGCPVPGKVAKLFLGDRLFAHFEREETITNLHGKLHNDLVRIRQILDDATPNSIVVMNEVFSSTTLQDALFLSKKVLAKICDLDLLGVWVTFLDELASFNEKTVSVTSTVDPLNPAIRTYKVERRRADGLAYAHAIAEKHHVTYEQLMERIVA